MDTGVRPTGEVVAGGRPLAPGEADGLGILHADLDAFYASVEVQKDPSLRGRPLLVGGVGARGVVTSASYEARAFGCRNAMPMAQARRLCPQAVAIPPDFAGYRRWSTRVMRIFQAVTPMVEPLALDEAFLDVHGARALLGDGVTIAKRLRAAIRDDLELSCSVGVATNKFIAKLASVDAKPRATPAGIRPGRGVFEVPPGGELDYLHALTVRRLWGVGPATLARLQRMGVDTVGDLAALDPQAVIGALGRAHGHDLVDLANGRDDRAVEPEREVKSIGHEETFAHDLHDLDDIRREITRLADAVASRLRAHGIGARTLTLKVRDGGFVTITRATTLAGAVDTGEAIRRAVEPLLEHVDLAAGVRLLGVSASKFGSPAEQLQFDDGSSTDPVRWHHASRAIDRVRERFGAAAIGPASSVAVGADGRRRVRIVRSGAQQWGPDHDGTPTDPHAR